MSLANERECFDNKIKQGSHVRIEFFRRRSNHGAFISRNTNQHDFRTGRKDIDDLACGLFRARAGTPGTHLNEDLEGIAQATFKRLHQIGRRLRGICTAGDFGLRECVNKHSQAPCRRKATDLVGDQDILDTGSKQNFCLKEICGCRA